jgi:hypothetical protein
MKEEALTHWGLLHHSEAQIFFELYCKYYISYCSSVSATDKISQPFNINRTMYCKFVQFNFRFLDTAWKGRKLYTLIRMVPRVIECVVMNINAIRHILRFMVPCIVLQYV